MRGFCDARLAHMMPLTIEGFSGYGSYNVSNNGETTTFYESMFYGHGAKMGVVF